MFSQQPSFAGLAHEQKERYLERSPSHLVEKLSVPILVQFARNDDDVDISEAMLLVNALKAHKPTLSEIVIYDAPEHGHYLNRQVDTQTLKRRDNDVQIDSWNRIWGFLKPDT